MKLIHKGGEPHCLATIRREADRIEYESGSPPGPDDWDLKACVDMVRMRLHEDQGGLCSYCCGRIASTGYEPTSRVGMKIEHFVARTTDPRRMYEWTNLLGVCGGRYFWAGNMVRTCDEARGARGLSLHPAQTPNLDSLVLPQRDGRLVGQTQDAKTMIDVLRLNEDVLCRNRAAVISDLQERLSKDDSTTELIHLLRVATPPPFPPYSFVAEWYLRLKLRGRA